MNTENGKDSQLAYELGKLYQSFVDRKLLCDFFVENVAALIGAPRGYLFLSGAQNKLWVESFCGPDAEAEPKLQEEVRDAYDKGQPLQKEKTLFLPLLVKNNLIGVACFLRGAGEKPFTADEFSMASNLTFQLAAALKTLLLFEQNLKMERLAAIGQTVGIVLHEVKNIIQLATFSNEFLKMGAEKKDERYLQRGMKGMNKAIREMDGFVYEMLSLTKDYKIHPENFRLQAIFQELEDDLREKAEQYRVRLECKIDPDFPEVEGEPRSFYRALLNLVKNALEASDLKKAGPFIRVSALPDGPDRYRILIEDNGQGMNDEVKAKLFQTFFSTKGEKGTGLGLMIIDRTVKAHHGELKFESELGQGTVFTLTFPRKIPV